MLWREQGIRGGGARKQMEGAHALGPIPRQYSWREKEEEKLAMLQGKAEKDQCLQ